MSWIDVTSEAGENVIINLRIYIIAKSEGKGTYLICRDPKQSLKVREVLSEIDFVKPWIKVKAENGNFVQINSELYISARQDGQGSYLICSDPGQSLKIHESVTQYRNKLKEARMTGVSNG